MPSLSPALATLIAAAPLLALPPPAPQRLGSPKLEWRVPDRAFVAYTKSDTTFEFPGDHRILRLGPDPAPGFYRHDLDEGRVDVPSPAVVDVPALLALSLDGSRARVGRRGKVRRGFDHVQKFGSMDVLGTIETLEVTEEGIVTEKGSFELHNVAARTKNIDRNQWDARRLDGECDLDKGTIEWTREVDTRRGRVTVFSFELRGVLLTRNSREPEKYPFHIAEKWTHSATRLPKDADFRTDVNRAIARAEDYLLAKLENWLEDPLLSPEPNERGRTYGTGRLALVLLALQKGSADRDRDPVPRAFDLLRKREPQDTYSLANAILALETLYESPNEIQQLREGLLTRPAPRNPSETDSRLLESWSKRLLAHHDSRVDPGYRLRFYYASAAHYDNSNTQYAALGLAAAARCGVKLSPTVWTSLGAHWLSEQRKAEARPRPLRLVTYRELRAQRSGSRRRGRSVAPRGMGYRTDGHPYGSMTCAGITGIQLALGMLPKRRTRATSRLGKELEQARHEAFAWLVHNWNIRNNPRKHRDHYFYWLYSLERGCELGGVAEVEGHDWYFEGAMQLFSMQHRNGSWGNLEQTCFGLLFLKKASAPVLTED